MIETELLDVERVRAGLGPVSGPLLSELWLATAVDSTNAEAMRQVALGAGSGLVCVAEQQTAGRGRRGRTWVSPFAGNIYMSLVWEFAGGASALEGLSLAVGVAVAEALERCGVPDVALKWPNDLLVNGAKLGGILIEMVGDAAGSCKVVIGVGLNVQMPEAAAVDIDQQWTDIYRATGSATSRNELLTAVLDELLPLLPAFERDGFGPWQSRWMSRDVHADSEVVVISGAQKLAGKARGVDITGALQLETDLGVQAIHGGEVSLRGAP